MKKSICIVSAQYYPHVGGVEQYVDNFTKELIKRGNSVTIITSAIDGTEEHEIRDNLEIYRLPSIQMMDGRFPVLKHNKRLKELTKKIREKQFDVMLVNTRFYFISLYAVRLAKKMNVRCIMLDHGTSHLNTGGKLTSKLGELFEHGITWLEKRYCKEFAGVSKATLEWIRHFHIKSEMVLYNAIDLEKFETMKQNKKRDFRKEYGIPKEDIVVGFVGRLTVEKGIRELTNTIAKINKTRKNVWLLAAGDGYLMEEMKDIKSENTCFVGRLEIQEVVDLLQDSDIFCLPSVSEGFPTSVLEAIVCNNFIITTYTGGAKEIIENEKYGVILPDNNEAGLYDTIMKVVDEEEYRNKAVRLSYDRVKENYTWKQTVDKFLTLL